MSQSSSSTRAWYEKIGWKAISDWITELSAKGLKRVYIENFEIIPSSADKKELCVCFNEDCHSGWKLRMELDGKLVAERK